MLDSSSLTFKSGWETLRGALKCISLLSGPKNRESYKQKDKKIEFEGCEG